MLQRITSYFFPANFAGSDEEHRQAVIIVNSILLTTFFSLNYALLSRWAQFGPGAYVMFANFCVYWTTLFAFKLNGVTYRQAGSIFILFGGLAIFLCGYYLGGFYGDSTIWLALLPAIGTFLLGRTGGLVSLGLALTGLLVLWYIEYRGVVLRNYLTSAEYRLLFRLNVVAGLMLILLVISFVFANVNARALTLVNEKNDLLRLRSDELQQSLDRLNATQAQLIQAEKMASLGELTAGIAHEIQNPLNFVNNFAEVSAELVAELRDEVIRPVLDAELIGELLDHLEVNLQKVTHHGSRASNIVRGMLEHSRTAPGEKTPTNLNALADEYLRLAYHGLRAKDKTDSADRFNAELVTEFDPNVGLVSVVAPDMGRVLLNLFNNAFFAVRTKRHRLDPGYRPTVTVRTQRGKEQVVITVEDNGTGIPERVRAKIFQPFFTTKPSGEGTGLGLSLSYDIITKGHGGTLTVNSEEGQGSEFIISLPIPA